MKIGDILAENKTIKTCVVCGEEFHNTNVNQIYCSEKCKQKALTAICKNCGEEFLLRKRGEHGKINFCSKSCATSWSNKHRKLKPKIKNLVTCEICGKEYQKKSTYSKQHNFCGKECYLKWARRKMPKDKKCVICNAPLVSWKQISRDCCSDECFEKKTHHEHFNDYICENCGKKFSRWKCHNASSKKHFCSHKCYTDYMTYHTNNDDMSYGKFRSRLDKTKEMREWKQAVLNKYDNRCTICNSEEDIRVHHIIPVKTIIKSFKIEKFTLDVMQKLAKTSLLNNINNGIVLCKHCHDLCHGKQDNENMSLDLVTNQE